MSRTAAKITLAFFAVLAAPAAADLQESLAHDVFRPLALAEMNED